jgi:hypothetical protein
LTAPTPQTADPKAGKAPAEAGKPAEKNGEVAGKPQGAPEKYEDFKAPEGLSYDPAVSGKWGEIAKALNLPQEAAQQHLATLAKTLHESSAAQLHRDGEEWAKETQADPEFGGTKFAESRAIAKKAFDKYASPELQKLLRVTRLENRREVFRWFYLAGKDLSVDGFVPGDAPKGGKGPRTDQELFYGDGK